jgi:hypothetical protein
VTPAGEPAAEKNNEAGWMVAVCLKDNKAVGNRDVGSKTTCSEGILEKQEKAVRARSALCFCLFRF